MVTLPVRVKQSTEVGVPSGQFVGGYLTPTSAASVNVPVPASGPLEAPNGDAAA